MKNPTARAALQLLRAASRLCLAITLALLGMPHTQGRALRADAGWEQWVYTDEEAPLIGVYSEGDVKEAHWDSGDEAVFSTPLAWHRYKKPGDYVAELRIRDAKDSTDASSVTVHAISPPPNRGAMPFRGLMIFPADPLAMPWDRQNTDSPDVDPQAELKFYDLDYWRAALNEHAAMGFNNFVFLSNHPYPHLVANPEFPEACPIDPAELQKNRETFHAILDMADKAGVEIYLLVYNIFVSEPFAKAHGLETRGMDTPLTRQYTAAYIKALFTEYPKLTGLILTVGESPLGCVEFCREAIMQPLNSLPHKPRVIIRDQAVYPVEMRALGGLLDWHSLVKISEEQFIGEHLGPRGRLIRQATGKPVIYLNSWLPDQLFFGSHRMIGKLVAEARDERAAGFLVQGGKAPEWLLREAFGYYMKHEAPSPGEADRHFEALVTKRFGAQAPARGLLDLGEINSQILPTIRLQFYSRNWNYRARYGLFLESICALPTFSSFRHPGNARPGTDLEQQFTWWLPRSKRLPLDVLTIEEYLEGTSPVEGLSCRSPLDTRRLLEEAAAFTIAKLPELRSARIESDQASWDRFLDQCEFLARIARFYAHRIDAGLIWRSAKSQSSHANTAWPKLEHPLRASVDEYLEAAAIYERLNGPVSPREPFRVVAPADQAHYSYVGWVNGGMRGMSRLFELELNEIKARLARGDFALPTFKELDALAQAGQSGPTK